MLDNTMPQHPPQPEASAAERRRSWAAVVLAALFLLLGGKLALARESAPVVGPLGITTEQLSAEFWVAHATEVNARILDENEVAARNKRLWRLDDSVRVLARMPDALDRATVRGLIEDRSKRPAEPLYDIDGMRVSKLAIDNWLAKLALDEIPESQSTQFGMVVQRAALRTMPTNLRVFDDAGDTDIDRFQESAVFPGTPLVVAHRSADGKWLFVLTPRYAAWIEAQFVASGDRDAVLAWQDKEPHRIITGAEEHTVYTPEEPRVSELQLDMGVRVPVLDDWPRGKPVNGQHPYSSWVIELPVRNTDGSLAFTPALLPRIADSSDDYLPLTRANIIRQAFKFLGERYGWGHSYHGRDCSGFVSEVFRSMGVEMPRNTSDQSVSPAFARSQFDEDDSRKQRMVAAQQLEIGDLVYIPGHVMLVIGKLDGKPWVIHDTTGISYLDEEGKLVHAHLNAVSVTPLLPLHAGNDKLYIDRMTNIVHLQRDAS